MPKLICPICKQHIANFEKISKPLKPEMFTSPNPERGVPDPFHPSLEWMWFRCPYCSNAPWHWDMTGSEVKHPTKLLTENGLIDIEPKELHKCKFGCGFEHYHKPVVGKHEKSCTWKIDQLTDPN